MANMKTFTTKEYKLIQKLRNLPPQATLHVKEPRPNHSFCVPLPLFRVYRVDEETFEAGWNYHHQEGPKQSFRFSEVAQD